MGNDTLTYTLPELASFTRYVVNMTASNGETCQVVAQTAQGGERVLKYMLQCRVKTCCCIQTLTNPVMGMQ